MTKRTKKAQKTMTETIKVGDRVCISGGSADLIGGEGTVTKADACWLEVAIDGWEGLTVEVYPCNVYKF